MAHTPQEDPGERRVGWPKRLVLTSDLSDYPRPLVEYADFIVSYAGSVIKNRSGKCGISATDAERRSCKTVEPAEAKILVDEGAWCGQPPAEGSRRATILEAIKRGDVLSDTEALEIADSVESALLRASEFQYPLTIPGNLELADQARQELAGRIEVGLVDPDQLIEIARLGE